LLYSGPEQWRRCENIESHDAMLRYPVLLPGYTRAGARDTTGPCVSTVMLAKRQRMSADTAFFVILAVRRDGAKSADKQRHSCEHIAEEIAQRARIRAYIRSTAARAKSRKERDTAVCDTGYMQE
jgi:hypothetical protein